MPRRPQIQLELLPHERAALLKWNYTPEVREQIEACASNQDVVTITFTPADIHWLTHAEAAAALGISPATADRHWSYARAWLQREMQSE